MEEISIEKKHKLEDGWEFVVQVGEHNNFSTHTVTVEEDYWELFEDAFDSPDELVMRSFEFLLVREPRESVLPEFDLHLISNYFPEYEDEMKEIT